MCVEIFATGHAAAARRLSPSPQQLLPVGADAQPEGGVPRSRAIEAEIERLGAVALAPKPGGYFSALVPQSGAQVVDSSAFAWTDTVWRGGRREELALYEMHIGIVYNHLDGNHPKRLSQSCFTDRYPNEGGEACTSRRRRPGAGAGVG